MSNKLKKGLFLSTTINGESHSNCILCLEVGINGNRETKQLIRQLKIMQTERKTYRILDDI